MIHCITIAVEGFLGNSSWKRMKSQSVFRQEDLLTHQKINLKTTLEFIICDSQSYFSGLIGATRPILRTFCWIFGTFLVGGGDTFYWLQMNHFIIYVVGWWGPTYQCKKDHPPSRCPAQQTQPINMNGVRITQR